MSETLLLVVLAALIAAPAAADVPGERHVPEDAPMVVERDDPLTEVQQKLLAAHAWPDRVGDAPGVWVSIAEQMCRVVQRGRVLWQAPCATSAKGPGAEIDSFKTPLGWHSVALKVGGGAPRGQVFRARRATDEIWRPGDDTDEDLVLTRVLALAGEEPGKNQGGNVDSFARNIYLHGTNAEDQVGAPSSHGCIRLTNDDVIAAFERIPLGAFVLITE